MAEPATTVRTGPDGGLVCTVDALATEAGVDVLRRGGTAADAAVAANAVLAVTSPHLCGMGGDLWAIVHEPGATPRVVNASGHAGSGVDAAALRARGLTQVPLRADLAAVPVPGCVDGWMALLDRYGRLGAGAVLERAIEVAEDGFPASSLLAMAAILVDHLGVAGIHAAMTTGDVVRRPCVATALRAIARDGRDGFYAGAFGAGLLELGDGVYTRADLQRPQADWHDALGLDVLGARVWTAPPGSQGYLTLAILRVAEQLGLPSDDTDPAWLRALVAATVVTGRDRPALLHADARGEDLLSEERLERWTADARRWTADDTGIEIRPGDTTYLCTRDGAGMAVSLIQSHAADFGAHLVEPTTGIFLHNRGVGFSLDEGHPAELAPGRRPPSTLSPMLVTDADDDLLAVTGTMGGDSQPHLMAQHLARLLGGTVPADEVLAAPRFTLTRHGDRGFDLWGASGPTTLLTDRVGAARWGETAAALGLDVDQQSARSPSFGHAHVIARTADGWVGCAEPRVDESAAGAHV